MCVSVSVSVSVSECVLFAVDLTVPYNANTSSVSAIKPSSTSKS